jgi:Trk-type K+ transport system membrane component
MIYSTFKITYSTTKYFQPCRFVDGSKHADFGLFRWVGSFNAVSAFNNSGMSLLDANMVAFQESVYMLITMGLLILAGNTCYPIFLRLIIWTLLKLVPTNDSWNDSRKTLQFLLDHPRRCYTNLFPRRHTYWLLAAVVVLNGIDWVAFEILNASPF